MLANREKSISHLQELNKKHGQRILKALNERKEHINVRDIDLSVVIGYVDRLEKFDC